MSMNGLRRTTPTLRAVLTVLLLVGGVSVLAAPAQAAGTLGSLTIEPSSGNLSTVITVQTPSACDQGTNIKATVTGTGVVAGTENIVGNTPISSFPSNSAGGFNVQLTETFASFAALQSPAITTYSGAYTITVICKNAIGASTYGTFEGTVYFIGTTNTWQSTPPPPAPTVVTAAVRTGTAQVTKTQTCSATFTDATTLNYVWLNNGVPIVGATASTYTLPSSLYSRTISCRVTATNVTGSISSTSAGAVVAAGPKPTLTKAPYTYGTFKVGYTVKTTNGSWSLSRLTYSYQWKRNGVAISGSAARKYSYKLVSADRGRYITCTVKVSKAGYASNSATTARKKVA